MTVNEIMMSLEIGLIYGIIAIGVYITFRITAFTDLTVDGSFVLGAAVSAMLIKSGYNPFFALGVSLLAGSLAGVLTGILNSFLKVTDILSGILVAFMLYSINLHIMNGMPNIALIGLDTIFTDGNPVLILALISILIVIIFSYLLNTDFGLSLRSLGMNKILAQNLGINIKIMTIIGLSISNSLIALGGAIFTQHQGFADVGSGLGTIIIGLASVIIGERILSNKSIWVQLVCCLLGSILYRIFISIALNSDVLGLESRDLNLITGLMVTLVMILPKRKIC